ncbi:MAG: response regulator [Candidatus Terrybacteria bacterium CG10_big_fil_rev_8_21_14_0_10_41_10]|uniref:Response regulator n=1 Tax=Candidatus Terrybacteria bacterium CG10_big_fil_rev_8_21_14_0_10_41_10 TaxID=1975026 RepID=A0A2M8LA88_9BACT|nr:MAG: response regulator [Candidatus Terrybacteria bacterium CG10_big_fil_rev_8_21_14_0_10_41_10]
MAKILLIEDDNDQILLYHTVFKMNGFDIISAIDGKIGLNRAKNEHPDLIILDLNMEEMSGEEVIKRLKKNPETKNIPVIILTNMDKKKFQSQMLELGAEYFWEKTVVMPLDVVKKVRDFLEKNKIK